MSATESLEDDGHCYVCGDKNADGLKLKWRIEGKETFADFVPQKKHQGWKDVLHGGLLATLLDEAMTRLAWKVCGGAVTAEMTVRYLFPAKVGEKLTVRGKITDDAKRLILAEGEIAKADGTIVAKSTGKILKV